MKQETPLHKKQNHVQTKPNFAAIIKRAEAPRRTSLVTGRRDTDERCDCCDPTQCWEPCGELGHSEEHAEVVANPVRDAAQGLIAGVGIGFGVLAAFAAAMNEPETFALCALAVVICMLGYLWLDD